MLPEEPDEGRCMQLDDFYSMYNNNEEFLTSKDEIFRELLHSKIHGNVVGICSDRLGNGMYLTAVEELLQDDGDLIAIIKPYDCTGHFFPVNRLHIGEITSVFPFKSKFENPFATKLTSSNNDELKSA
jgi:hypothetical protein